MGITIEGFGVTAQSIELLPGTLGAVGTGAYTMAAMYSPYGGAPSNGFGDVIGLFAGTTITRALFQSGGPWFGPGDFSSGYGTGHSRDWYILGQSKPAGNAHYRFHEYDYTTSVTTPSGESVGSANHADGSAITKFLVGDAGVTKTYGGFAWVAVWKRVLTDAEFESMYTQHLSDVMALSPDALVPFNVAAFEDITDVTGNGANYVTHTGANVALGADPPGYDFTLSPPASRFTRIGGLWVPVSRKVRQSGSWVSVT